MTLLNSAWILTGSLSKGVFELRTSNGSDIFSILKHLDATKFAFLSVFTIIEAICPNIWGKPPSKNEKKKDHFRLTRVGQKRLRLSSLIAPQSRKILDTKTEGIRTCQSNLRNHHHPNVCKISRLCGTIYSLVWVSLKRQPYLFQGVLSNGANVFSLTDPPESL